MYIFTFFLGSVVPGSNSNLAPPRTPQELVRSGCSERVDFHVQAKYVDFIFDPVLFWRVAHCESISCDQIHETNISLIDNELIEWIKNKSIEVYVRSWFFFWLSKD